MDPVAARTLLLTGKGGVGKTTVAAATAVHSARRGLKTLVLSTDPAHSLADALAAPLGPVPTEVEPGLFALQVDPRSRLETHWRQVQEHLVAALDELGVDAAAAEEMTVLPAAEEVLALLELRDQVRGGRWDVVVVDCAPTAETLRLLALPEALALYASRAVPVGRRVARAVRAGLVGDTHDPVLTALHRLAGELADVRAVLTSPRTAVRLVLTPDSVVLAEARRSLTALALYGYPVDAAVVNRLVPDGQDPWRSARPRPSATSCGRPARASATSPCSRCRTRWPSRSASTPWPGSPPTCTARTTRWRWSRSSRCSTSSAAARSWSCGCGSRSPGATTSTSPGAATTSC